MITPIILGSIIGITGGTIAGNSIENIGGNISFDFKKGIEKTNKNGFLDKMILAGTIALGCFANEVRKEVICKHKEEFKDKIECYLYTIKDDMISERTNKLSTIQDKIDEKLKCNNLDNVVESMRDECKEYSRLEYYGLASLRDNKCEIQQIVESEYDEMSNDVMNKIDDLLDDIHFVSEAVTLSSYTTDDLDSLLDGLTN